jgi:hypothetical protein
MKVNIFLLFLVSELTISLTVSVGPSGNIIKELLNLIRVQRYRVEHLKIMEQSFIHFDLLILGNLVAHVQSLGRISVERIVCWMGFREAPGQ